MKFLKSTIAAGMLCIPAISQANLIVNGDFEAGILGITSDYTYVPTPDRNGPGGSWIEGTYAIDTNPNNDHALWTSFGDHTSGHGNMMIVNGSPLPNQNVWGQAVALAAGTYMYSAWVANTYAGNPATLQLSLNGSAAVSFNPVGDGTWQQWTYTFNVPVSQTLTIVDLNLALSGNDFALDDISLTAVPDGGLTAMLLGMGMLGLGCLRRSLK